MMSEGVGKCGSVLVQGQDGDHLLHCGLGCEEDGLTATKTSAEVPQGEHSRYELLDYCSVKAFCQLALAARCW